MSFKIEITETKEILKMVQGKWGKIKDDPEAYGYATNREELVREFQVIYIQTVEELDLKGVISAVNRQTRFEEL